MPPTSEVPPPDALSASELADLDRVLASAGLVRTAEASRIALGTLNHNYRVPTDGGPLFVRHYRAKHDRPRVEREHAITRWATDRGVPAIAPVPLADGSSIADLDGQLWAVFPWIDGRVPNRGAATPSEAEAIGDAHGHTQLALADHPESAGVTLASLAAELAWDTANASNALRRVERAATEVSASATTLEAIAFHRSLLDSSAPRPFTDFATLPAQLLHGDFHDQQVLLDERDQVAAVVDWELTHVAAPIWELIRALSYAQFLETARLDDYLRGFSRHTTIAEADCRAGIELWWQTRLHGTWVYEAYFLEGNDRVASFLGPTEEHLRRFADRNWRTEIADRLVAGIASAS